VTRLRSLKSAAIAAALYASAPGALACFLESPQLDGLSIAHPGVIPVALATRSAVDQGRLPALPSNAEARKAQLMLLQLKIRSRLPRLAMQRVRSEHELAIYLTQSGAWLQLNDPATGVSASYHTPPPGNGTPTAIIPDTAYAEILAGKMTLSTALELGLIEVDSPSKADALASLAGHFGVDGFVAEK
jgi:hypothetical protein